MYSVGEITTSTCLLITKSSVGTVL